MGCALYQAVADRAGTDAGRDAARAGQGDATGRGHQTVAGNLFLHYAFYTWMDRNFPTIRFERYADDVVILCKSLVHATMLRDTLKQRLVACKLEMSPSKTKIVYCKDRKRTEEYPEIGFDFLGYTFRPRKAKARDGSVFLNFLPAMSGKAAKAA